MKTLRKISLLIAIISIGYLIVKGYKFDINIWCLGLFFGVATALIMRQEYAVVFKKPFPSELKKVTRSVKFVINKQMYDDLVQGGEINFQHNDVTVHLILADIGWDEMINSIKIASGKD